MSRMKSLWRNLVHRDRVERDLDDEVRAAVDELVSEKIRAGERPEDARRAAMLEIGGVEALKERVRDVRAGALMDELLQDVRYATRLLRRNPLFALTAAISLAIGIGATTTIFTVANGLLLRATEGVSAPDGLVDIVRTEPRSGPGITQISYPDLLEIRRRTVTLENVFGYQLQPRPVSMRIGGQGASSAFVSVVTTNYFSALGVTAAPGRLFGAADDDRPGASPVAVLSHGFWTRRFQADPAVIGQVVGLNDEALTVVGVAREGFRGTSVVAPDLWLPTSMIGVVESQRGERLLTTREAPWLMLGGRLKAGVSRARASAEIATIGQALELEAPTPPLGGPFNAPPGSGMVDVAARVFLWSAEVASPIPAGMRLIVAGFLGLLMVLVSLVLVIACANVAGVLLARAAERRREIAVRVAIGAGRARLVRQLLTETMLLFLLGGAAGLLLARGMTSMLVALLPAFPVPVSLSLPLDVRVMAFSVGVSLLAAALSGLAPALHASKADVVSALKDEAPGASDRLRLRYGFVVAQVAFSLLLVIMTGLLAQTFDRVTAAGRGFDPTNVDVASVDLSMAGYTEVTGREFARTLVERVRAIPAVEEATLADRAPEPGSRSFGFLTVPGATPSDGQPFFFANWTLVEPGYFSTLRIPLTAGRDFTARDSAGAQPVAIVSRSTAEEFWPGEDALGKNVVARFGNPTGPNPLPAVTFEIVGIVRDLTFGGPSDRALYIPFQQRYMSTLTVLARSSGDRRVMADLRAALTTMDPNMPVLSARTLESQLSGPVETQLRVAAAVAGSVGLVGLLLAAVGVYGVTALVLRHSMILVAIGTAVGLTLGAGAGRLLAASRFGTPAGDPLVFAAATLLFAAAGFIACYVPVRRATRINAMEALRYE